MLWLLLTHIFLAKSDSLFVKPSSERQLYPQLKLTTADKLGVPYQGIAYNASEAASYAGFALSLNAEFGPMDETSFEQLQRAYCLWSETKSRVSWRSGESYTLLDFLPPLLQAVSGLHFRSSRSKQNDLPSLLKGDGRGGRRTSSAEVLLTSNCWGFAWEVLFQADNADTSAMTISTADPTSAWRAFTGPGFDLIQSTRTKPTLLTDPISRNRKLQSGDVLLIWHQNPSTTSGTDLYLDHVAICIDDDVYYEKSGSGDRVPFRLSTWDMITRNFPPSIFFWEWRRLVRNNAVSPNIYGNVPRLPPATDIFGLESQESPGAVKEQRWSKFLDALPLRLQQRVSLQADIGDNGAVEGEAFTGIVVLEDLVFDPVTGRASLPKTAFQQEWYTEMQRMLFRQR